MAHWVKVIAVKSDGLSSTLELARYEEKRQLAAVSYLLTSTNVTMADMCVHPSTIINKYNTKQIKLKETVQTSCLKTKSNFGYIAS